jgi:hypothetical protein
VGTISKLKINGYKRVAHQNCYLTKLI